MTRTMILIATMMATLPLAAQEMISSFEDEAALEGFGIPNTIIAERVQERATDGEWALRLDIPGSEQDTWPGVTVPVTVDSVQYTVFAFDAFNPQDDTFKLSWRVDFEDGEREFGGASFDAEEAKRVEIWIAGRPAIERILIYRRMPRTDKSIIIDNLHWDTVEGRFTPLHYIDDTPAPEPTTAESDRGFVLFARPFTDVVFANSAPRAEERIESVDAIATPGEYEPATFALHALEDLAQVRVSFDGIPATGEVLPIRALDKRVTYSSDRFIKDMPVLCERREAVDVAAGASKRWVLDLQVAEDASPGIHEGSITIAAEGHEPVSVPMRLRVLPFTLEEPTDMFWGEYYKGPQLADTEEGRLEEMRRDLADQRAHGMTSVGLTFGIPQEAVQWDGERYVLDLDATLYAAFMDMYVDLGFTMPIIQLADSGQHAPGMVDMDFESEEWGERYKAFWRAVQAECERRGWPEVIVQPVDEPGWKDDYARHRNVRCLKLLTEIPGMRSEQDGPGDDYFEEVAGPWADVWNYNGGIGDDETVDAAQANGHIVTIYNCDVESYRPEVDRYVAGWFQVAADISGCYNWAYMSWGGTPYDDQDHNHGTWMHVYPAIDGEVGGPSTGWIGAREGVDDYRYVHTLQEAIERAEASDNATAKQAAANARAELDRITDTIRYSPRVRNAARWTETGKTDDGRHTIGGTLKLTNGWTHAEYALNRWLVAEQTMAVMRALGEIED
ncbi:MAG: hypothetical protein GF393_10405 [Armatimonadia bacterium]|nr:hypothetical protein [Armatimonadia bacterium]